MKTGVLVTIKASYNDKAMFLLELYRKALSLRKNELYEYFLDHAVEMTKSKIGFFHFVNDDGKIIALTSWNRQALKSCKANYATHYPIEKAGNWADSIRNKKPVIYNDFEKSPNQKGLPFGHVKISRLLSFPLIEDGIVVAIFGVGNKDEAYTQDDIVQLDLISDELNRIIKQRRAEAALAASKEKYRSLFRNMIDGFAYCKMIYNKKHQPIDFEYLEVNDAFERLTGLKKELVLGKRVTKVIHGIRDQNPELFGIYGRVSETGKEEKFEIFFKPLNIWLSISVYSPRKGYFAAVFENITERKNAEEALRESEERWATTISSIGDGVIATDTSGKITFMNSVAEALTGWKLKEARKKDLKEVFNIINELTKKEVESPILKIIRGGAVVGLGNHTVLISKDGTQVPIDDSGSPIKDKEGNVTGAVLVFRDISERKQAEESLKQSEVKFRTVADYNYDWEYWIDSNGDLVYISPSCYRYTGYSAEEFLKYPDLLACIVHPDDSAVYNTHYRLKRSDEKHELDFRIIRKDGETRWIGHACQPVFDGDGKWLGRRISNRDITERIKSEEALRESEERLERSEQIAHLGSWELNIKQNKLTWSDEVYRIFGLNPQEFSATYEAFLNLVHPDDRATVDTAYSGSLIEGKPGYEIEHRIVRKDTGEIRVVHEKCSHVRDETGRIFKSVGMIHDITEHKIAENALRESEERLQLKLDSVLSPDLEIEEKDLANIIDVTPLQSMMNYLYSITSMGFALVDLRGNVLVGTGWQDICMKFHRINTETLRNCIDSDLQLTTGLKKGELRLYKCKNNMWDIMTPLYIGEKHMGNLLFGQFFFELEDVDRDLFSAQSERYGFNKEEYLKAFDRIPRFSREKIEYLMIFYSKLAEMISKLSYSNLKLAKALSNQKLLRRQLEDKAREVEEYAVQMEELAEERGVQLKDAERLAVIGQTAGMVGHDIRNPLQSILGDVFLAKVEVKALPDGEAKASLNESLESIEDAIEYVNKIVADLQDFARPLKPNLQAISIQKIINGLLSKANIPSNIKVVCTIDEAAHKVMTDETLLRRVLVNLITNAVQAMPQGGVLAIRAHREKPSVAVYVQDTGNGIPEDVKAKLFTPLFTTKSKGQGFGLAVVKRLTEALGGEVTFHSQAGEGTTFILRLPVVIRRAKG